MKILFFGDSITSAENNGFNGFVEKLNLSDYENYGVSGSTIGDYSIYPVFDSHLIKLLQIHKHEIIIADMIFLEYGCNDISAVISGYTTMRRIILDLIKSKDYIMQLNPNIKIFFIGLGNAAQTLAINQCNYLNSEYLRDLRICIDYNQWLGLYKEFERAVKAVIPNYLSLLSAQDLTNNLLDSDMIHPNDAGYQVISDDILQQLNNHSIFVL